MSTPLQLVRAQIEQACANAGRDPNTVNLIAVSKTWDAKKISPLITEGQSVFGENKLQELEIKAPALPQHLEWHFIGGLQRNKVRKVLKHAHWIHSVDSTKLLHAINRIAEEEAVTPKLFLQINLEGEESKGGFAPDQALAIVQETQSLTQIQLTGLMCIPKFRDNPEDMRSLFAELRTLRDNIQTSTGIALPHLSMGMSHDYAVAVEEGATHVRVGSALFGKRNYSYAST